MNTQSCKLHKNIYHEAHDDEEKKEKEFNAGTKINVGWVKQSEPINYLFWGKGNEARIVYGRRLTVALRNPYRSTIRASLP